MCRKKWMVCIWVALGIALVILEFAMIRADVGREGEEGTFVQAFSAHSDRCCV